jgi:hypothetical protein
MGGIELRLTDEQTLDFFLFLEKKNDIAFEPIYPEQIVQRILKQDSNISFAMQVKNAEYHQKIC